MRSSVAHACGALVRAALIAFISFIAAPIAIISIHAASASAASTPQRYLVVVRGAADLPIVRALCTRIGATIIFELPEIKTLGIRATTAAQRVVAASPLVAGVARDGRVQVAKKLDGPRAAKRHVVAPRLQLPPARSVLPASSITPDPALGSYAGILWDYQRIGTVQSWAKTAGQAWVTVGVVSTGIDSTHVDMATKVVGVQDFTVTEDPNLCSTQFADPTDAQLATAFGAPSANLDFNGLGTFIAGQIAGHLDGQGIMGIAPKVELYSLKVAQNCGVAYDSSVIRAILFAGREGIDVIDLPFTHYLNRSNSDDSLTYSAYVAAVAHVQNQGTAVVAAAGDQHAEIGTGGHVLSHGILSDPPGGSDKFGLWEVPGGIAGVIDVSSTSRLVVPASASCPGDALAATGHEWCKPNTDKHQPLGPGTVNQLAFYSNYGSRIDIAAPGGANKFNLPKVDRGGTEGWPWTGQNSVEGGTSVSDQFNVWENFGITSNYATQIPCFTFTGQAGFPQNQCYAVQQGTAQASAHVAAVYALLLSGHSNLLANVAGLKKLLLASVTSATNHTTILAAGDKSAGDNGSPTKCTGGFCHLSKSPIANDLAYGAGIVKAP